MKERRSTGMRGLLAAGLCLCLVLALIPASAAETAAYKTSPWAKETVDRAIAMGLASESLPGEAGDFTAPITRDDFCTLALNYLGLANNNNYFRALINKYKVNKRPDGQADNPFTDRNTGYTEYGAEDVTMCYYLGIAKGSTDGSFGYGRSITRQEVAAMLFRAYAACGGELPAEPVELTFHDQASIQDWARDDVAALLEWKVMTGDDKGNFDPDGLCTCEQAVSMFLRLYDNAPVRIANGNVKQMFTYEQCMEYLLSLNGMYYVRKDETVEGPYATYVRMDEGNMGRISRIMFVYRNGGVRVADPGINIGVLGGIPANATIKNAQFSLDGRTFSCDIHALVGGADGTYYTYHVEVDLDTLACKTTETATALSDMTGEQLAYLDLESAPEDLRPQILRARLPIIYGKQGWTVDGLGSVQHADGTAEKLPEFSDLWPDWTVPFGPEWRKYGVMDPSDKGTSFYTTFLLGVSEKTGYWEFILQNDGEAGCYFTIEGEDHTLVYTSEIIPAHTRQQVLCAPDQPLAPGFYHVSVHSAQEGVSPKGTIWHYQYASYEMLTK